MKIDASEGIAEIPQNRTLLVEQLTKDEPVAPEVVTGLTNIDEVFAHFMPEIDIEFSDAEGAPVEENFRFHNVGGLLREEDDGTESFPLGAECGKAVRRQDGEILAIEQGAATGSGKSGNTQGVRQYAVHHVGRIEGKREV